MRRSPAPVTLPAPVVPASGAGLAASADRLESWLAWFDWLSELAELRTELAKLCRQGWQAGRAGEAGKPMDYTTRTIPLTSALPGVPCRRYVRTSMRVMVRPNPQSCLRQLVGTRPGA